MKTKLWLILISLVFLTQCRYEDASKVTYGKICKGSPNAINSEIFEVNFNNLTQQLFSQNTSILMGINQLHQSKIEVNIARSRLLPSLNLTNLLFASANPSFAVNSIEIMLPFLAPSNWAHYRESKHLVKAQKEALTTIQYNSLASALSSYLSIHTDLKLIDIYNKEVQDLKQVHRIVENLYMAGLSSKNEVDRSSGTLEFSQVGLSKVKGLVSVELAQFKHLLGIEPSTQLNFRVIEIAHSELEELTLKEVIQKAKLQSPELRQIQHIRKAAEENIWSHQFAFIGGGSIASPAPNSNGSVSFDNLTGGMQFNIGFTQVPLIELSRERLEEIKLREQEIHREINERAEYSLSLVLEAQQRYLLAQKALHAFSQVYQRDLVRYQFGQLDLFTVLESRSKLREAQVEQLRAETQLALNRIVMQRLTLSNQFTQVELCEF